MKMGTVTAAVVGGVIAGFLDIGAAMLINHVSAPVVLRAISRGLLVEPPMTLTVHRRSPASRFVLIKELSAFAGVGAAGLLVEISLFNVLFSDGQIIATSLAPLGLSKEPATLTVERGKIVEANNGLGPEYLSRLVAHGDAAMVIDPVSLQYIAGAEIDFVDDLIGAAFKVNNPQAKASCGCGVSFTL